MGERGRKVGGGGVGMLFGVSGHKFLAAEKVRRKYSDFQSFRNLHGRVRDIMVQG